MTSETPSITCPVCQRTSPHPRDVEEGYCGHCHAFTTTDDLHPATRQDLAPNRFLWVGYANGMSVSFLTRNPHLVLYTVPINTPDTVGVLLVDGVGKVCQRQLRWIGSHAAAETPRGEFDAWLLAQVDLDERTAAHAAAASTERGLIAGVPWIAAGSLLLTRQEDGTYDTVASVVDYRLDPVLEHAARWDPARVRAECALKRQVIQACADMLWEHESGPDVVAAATLRAYGEHYAAIGRDGYKQEWRDEEGTIR